jgi:hypothetical protein
MPQTTGLLFQETASYEAPNLDLSHVAWPGPVRAGPASSVGMGKDFDDQYDQLSTFVSYISTGQS